jgi:ABC-type multidrug transport system fused ATPase/permease subunit
MSLFSSKRLTAILQPVRTCTADCHKGLKTIFTLTKELWDFDRQYAIFTILITIFISVQRYSETLLDASLLTQCILVLQDRTTFDKTYFAKLLLLKILLLAASYIPKWFHRNVEHPKRHAMNQARIQRLLTAYLHLPYSEQEKESVRGQFRKLIAEGGIRWLEDVFADTVESTCQIMEALVITLATYSNFHRMSGWASVLLVSITLLHFAYIVDTLRLESRMYKTYWNYKSEEERRATVLEDFPVSSKLAAQEVKLFGAREWVLSTLEADHQKIPPKPNRWNRDGEDLLGLLEWLGLPILALFFDLKIDLESYNLAVKRIGSLTHVMRLFMRQMRDFQGKIIPKAQEYLGCLEMGEVAAAEESKLQDTVDRAIDTIELEGVSHWYEGSENEGKDSSTERSENGEKKGVSLEEKIRLPALDNFNFMFESGKVYSIIGQNGSGKSTLIKILTKLINPTSGKIYANGKDLSNTSDSEWLQHLSVVAQGQAFLRQTTIHDNIAFGDTSLLESDPDNLITQEAEAFGVHNFVDLNTFYGDNARSKDLPKAEKEKWIRDLSGGQWRTIALARTFCRKKNATVFLLDEPSSSLDAKKEHQLFERLRKEREGRITIFISHNLQTCRVSDGILVMDKGKLVEFGSHAELMDKEDGVYAGLYRCQNETWYTKG